MPELSDHELLKRIAWTLALISDQLELAAVEREEGSDADYRNELVDRISEKRNRLESLERFGLAPE